MDGKQTGIRTNFRPSLTVHQGMLPTFFVLGTAKAGTTSLYDWLRQHPDVFMSPVKEPRFFAAEGLPPSTGGPFGPYIHEGTVRTLKAYEALFAGAGAARARGEASPNSLYSAHAAGRIRHHIPDARLVAVLRDPAERAHSHWLHLRRDGMEPCADFREALDQEPARIAADWEWSWHYRAMGFYDQQLARYAARFPAEGLHVVLYEDLARDPLGVARGVFSFIGVDPAFVPDVRAALNVGGVPANAALYGVATRYDHPLRRTLRPLLPERARLVLLARLRRKALARPALDPEVRADLVRGYAEDLHRLQDRLRRDLSAWLTA